MGMVLSFSPRAKSANSSAINDGRTAEIVIFPGIRYERIEDDAPVEAVGLGRKKAASRKKSLR